MPSLNSKATRLMIFSLISAPLLVSDSVSDSALLRTVRR